MPPGRGVPLDRYAQRKFGFTAAREPSAMHPIDRAANYFMRQSSVDVSPALSSLINDAPWLRVQETADQSAYIASRDRVLLAPSGRNSEGLAHELEHREQNVSGAASADFDEARKLLKHGDVQAAQASFLAARLKQEASAISKGESVAKDFGQKPIGAGQADIANMHLHDGRTYAQLWQDEFKQFAASNGQVEPDVNYAPARKALLGNPQYWESLLNRWDKLSQKDKLNSLRELDRAPEKSRLRVFTQAMLKPGEDMSVEHETSRKSLVWSVREIADSQFKSLLPADRIKAFNQMLKSDDYHVRTLAISHIGDLPARARTEAFYNVLQHSRALIIPDTGRRTIFDSFDDEEKLPLFPGWDNSALTPVLKSSPARLLMESIADLPASDRQRAWISAYEYSRVGKTRYGGTGTLHPARQAAIGAFDVLPEGSRPAMWNRAWNDVSSSHKNTLVEQIASLPESARLDAFNKVFAGPQSMKGESVGKAIASLAVSDRLPSWQKLFARSRKDWTSTPEFREEAAIAGIAPDTAYVDPFASSPYASTRYDAAFNRRRSASILSDTSSVDRGLARSIEVSAGGRTRSVLVSSSQA